MLIKEANVLEFDFCELNKFIKEFSEAKRSIGTAEFAGHDA